MSMKPIIKIEGMTTVSDKAVFFSFDDHSIPARSNLKLTMKQAEKYPHNPVLKPGASKEPDARAATIYGSVRYIKGKFRMWYLAEPKLKWERGDSVQSSSRIARTIAYAESSDGIHWEKPDLGLVKFRGSKDNNLVLIEPEGHPLSAPDDYCCVLYDPEDPDRCYKMAYIVFLKAKDYLGDEYREILNRYPQGDSRILTMMACATSKDGLHWKLVHKAPPIKENFEVAGLYKFNDKYYVEGQQLSPWVWLTDVKSPGRVMVSFESKDFITWSQSKIVSFVRNNQESCPIDQNYKGEQVHMGAGIWNRGNVLLGVYGQWHGGKGNKTRRIDLGLIVSNDGLHFREPLPNFALVPRGQEEEWDSLALTQGHAFENVNDKTYIWYGQWDITGEYRADKFQAIGLATLRRDGFGYLSAKYSNVLTHFLTCPVKITDGKANLFLNIEGVCKGSSIRVALVDDAGTPLRGYTETDCLPIVEEGISVQVKWQGENTSLPQDISFRVKVIFPKGTVTKFYAAYIR